MLFAGASRDPCQDISVAGKGAGLSGARSGLYRDVLRAIRMVRPKYVLLENVAVLLSRGLGTILGDLAEIGYDAEWYCIPASRLGAHHRRDRVWIVAYPDGVRELQPEGCEREQRGWTGDGGEDMANTEGVGLPVWDAGTSGRPTQESERRGGDVADANGPRLALGQSFASHDGTERKTTLRNRWWPAEPEVGRVVDGFAGRVDQLHALGNSLIPQIPELIGRAILAAEQHA